jgi:hypothetical protein
MPTIKDGIAGNGAYMQEKLDQVEQLVRDLAQAVLFGFGERTSAWEIANRVCDSYCLPKVA